MFVVCWFCQGLIEKQKATSEKLQINLDDSEKRSRTSEIPLSQFQNMNDDDLLVMLKETKSLHDEADILHYLFERKFYYSFNSILYKILTTKNHCLNVVI